MVAGLSRLQYGLQRWFSTQECGVHLNRVIGDLLGRWAQYIVMVVISISLFGTCLSQIVASSADAYYISQTIDKR
jgi:hypothetical protein